MRGAGGQQGLEHLRGMGLAGATCRCMVTAIALSTGVGGGGIHTDWRFHSRSHGSTAVWNKNDVCTRAFPDACRGLVSGDFAPWRFAFLGGLVAGSAVLSVVLPEAFQAMRGSCPVGACAAVARAGKREQGCVREIRCPAFSCCDVRPVAARASRDALRSPPPRNAVGLKQPPQGLQGACGLENK